MMFYFKSILQIWIILIGFRDTNDFVNLGICKHEFKFTCRGYCRFTLKFPMTSIDNTVTISHSKPEEQKALISLATNYMLNCLNSNKHGDETKLESFDLKDF